MLDDVERGRFLVEPAREDPLEAAVRNAHVELDEGPGQLLRFPGRGRLAGAQAHDHVPDADRLARLHLEVARDAVPLVEEPEHRHALRHRSGAGCLGGDGLRDVDRLRLRLGQAVALVALAPLAAGKGGRAGEDEKGASGGDHSSPGVQAS
jgi:hypothetical protein